MPFVKGQSGNPAGRPRGCRSKVNREFDLELLREGKYVARQLFTFFREGNPTAMRLVMQRMSPVSRGRPVEVALPELASVADRPAAVAEIRQALGDGEITVEEASGLLKWVDQALGLDRPAAAPEVLDLAREVAQLRETVAQLTARLGAGSVCAAEAKPAIDPISAESMPEAAAPVDDGHQNHESNPNVTTDTPAAHAAAEGAAVDGRSMPGNADVATSKEGAAGVPALAGEIYAAASGDGAAAPSVIDPINAESTPQAAAAPAPIADAAPAGTREPVTIRENTGAGSDPLRADDLLPPFAGNPVSMTISPDVLALMHELDVARASGIANAATVAAEPGDPADGAAAAQGESHAGRQYARP